MSTGEQNIFRLDIAMQDVVLMRVVQRLGDFARDADGVTDGQLLLAFDPVTQ